MLLALGSAELDVRAVTVAAGNVGLEHTLANARAIVALAGTVVPVFAGADRPLLGALPTPAPGDNGLAGVDLPPGRPAAAGIAADAIRRIIRDAAAPVTVVGIGPATNLALAFLAERSLATKVERFVLMSGAWGEGNITPAAEFNAFCDPEALAVILALERPTVFATLELTAQALMTPARLAALRSAAGGVALHTACDIQARVPPSRRLGGQGAALHDPCAVAWLLRPDLFTARPARITVDCGAGASRGRTNVARFCEPGSANAMLLETLEADGFFNLLGERLAKLP